MSAFYSACEEAIELEEMGIVRKRRLQIGLFIPYGIDEGRVPEDFFDGLPNTAEPFWLREMSMKEYVKEYSN